MVYKHHDTNAGPCGYKFKPSKDKRRCVFEILVANLKDVCVLQMYQAMAEEEQKKAAPVQFNSPVEKKINVQRSFASKAQ